MPPKKNINKSGDKVNDPRFSKIHNDPRFLRPKKADTKVKIDNRFKSMLTSKDFGTGAGPKVDKYGRKLQADTAEKELKRFYHIEDDDEEDDDSDGDNKSLAELEKELMADEGNLEDEESSDEEDQPKVAFGQKGYDPMRGKGVIDESDTSDEEMEDEESEEDEEDKIPHIEQGEETKRLALVNLDWDKVKAMDIFQVLNGFKPKAGVIERVTIFPSEFGKERIEKEEREGPPKDIFKATGGDNNDDDDDSDEEVTEKTIIRDQVEEGMGEDFDQEALRKYQLDRLRYYYAVVECDSPFTAKIIYQSCDGNEYENSANFFDMRYIPDEMTFDDAARDSCTQVSDNYKPLKFKTDALQHTRVKLTWDQDQPERVQMTRREFTESDLKDLDFDAYLASSDDDEDSDNDEDVDALRAKYRKLLESADSNAYDDKGGDDEDDAGDMEITFTPGLSEKTGAVDGDESEDQEKEETSIEKYMRKQKEKRMAKKERREMENNDTEDNKYNKKKSGKKSAQAFGESDNDEELDGDSFFKEARAEMEQEGAAPVVKEKKKNKKKKLTKEERMEQKRQKAELELLMDDDQTKGEGFNMKDVLKLEKLEKKKGKKSRKEKELLESAKDDFEINVQDPRFAALQDSHHFAIDPTNPQFKKTKNMKKLMESRQTKFNGDMDQAEEWKKDATPKVKVNDTRSCSAVCLLFFCIDHLFYF
ncbi:hypothetical protein BCR42DRAFT_424202 [Absidia repens]|uniref:Uncharacterized protein n=1 Tax=Absidia repens TaxID=90262 RepID=A0A1X2I3X6_9FUNG|nr:hypothetical protein BCR42DRAFT_424202 [Absidia repens]